MIPNSNTHAKGFTLVEVVLAIGIIGVAVLALLGMFAPTMNSVKNVIDSDLAVSATGSINSYLQQEAEMDFGTIEDIIDSASESSPSSTSLFAYLRNTNKIEELYVTTFPEELDEDLKGGNLLSGVIRVDIYRMLESNGYDYSNVNLEAYVPMMLKIYSVEPNAPSLGGSLIMTYPTAVTR